MTHTYSRPGGMSQLERAKTLRRLGGATVPNASGARAEAPAILASSEPSRELIPPVLTPEEIKVVAEANRKARALEADIANGKAQPGLSADPVNGQVDPLDAIHEEADSLEPVAQDEPDSLLE